jgi:hypothetical protein
LSGKPGEEWNDATTGGDLESSAGRLFRRYHPVMHRPAALVSVLIGSTLLAWTSSATAEMPANAIDDDDSVEVTWGVKIPMRDGVHLNVT